MTSYKHRLYTLLFASGLTAMASAQTNGTNSPYSRFGLGMLDDQSQGFNRGMSGLAIGQQAGNRINMINPASYAATDSLSFLFDVGMSIQNGNFKSGDTRINAHNTSLDYVNGAFRIRKGLGFSFGFVPYSSIGYNFTSSQRVGTDHVTGQEITSRSTYYGDGGIHQIYVGAGWTPFKNFSIGANVSFLWGNYYHSIAQTLYNNDVVDNSSNSLNRQFNANIETYKLDFGIQYQIPLKKGNKLTLGAIAGIGHRLHNDVTLLNYTLNGDSISRTASDAFQIPYSFGVGVSWQYKDRWNVGVDVHHERWADCVMPVLVEDPNSNKSDFAARKGLFQNRTKAILGAEFIPDSRSRKYLRRVQYKIGASYATPYAQVNGSDGPQEFGVTAGFGLPISNNINNRSVVNVSFQWLHVRPSHQALITENYLRLNVGITFNERWFMKWKIN